MARVGTILIGGRSVAETRGDEMSRLRGRHAAAVVAALGILVLAAGASAEPFAQGPQKCLDCHKAEHGVWEGTKHAKSFADIHRKPEVRAIIQAAGGDSNMRRNAVCMACHCTAAKADIQARPNAVAGPSCESCHGASSDWFALHNDYGGPSAKRESEAPAAKAERVRKSREAGMIWPAMLFDVATNCLSCHGLTRPGLEPAVLAKMIEAGHPSGSDFELLRYSQGTVRHRFYPPNLTTNAEMTPAERARTFITGHAAALVQGAAVKLDNPKYQEVQKKIETAARAALDAIKGQVPEAAALLAQPSDANARKLVEAIAGKDLAAPVGGLLPAAGAYK